MDITSYEYVDVTDKVEYYLNDDEVLPILKCICGKEYKPWIFLISIYPDNPDICENCGRKFFFRPSIKIFEVVELKEQEV